MSVQTQIDRIKAAKNDIGAAIAEKGTTVPDGTKIDGMAALIRAIEGGDGIKYANGSVTMAESINVGIDNPFEIEHNLGTKPYCVFLVSDSPTPGVENGLAHIYTVTLYGAKLDSSSTLWFQNGAKRGSSSSRFTNITTGSQSMSNDIKTRWTETVATIPVSGGGRPSFILESGRTYNWVVLG